jgi:hypothetical protein
MSKCQQHSPGNAPKNVDCAVGESLVRIFNDEKMLLLEQVKERIRVKNSIDSHLQALNHSTFFAGTSRTLFCHHNSNMELCIIPSTHTTDGDINNEMEQNILQQLVCKLKAEENDKEKNNLFFEVRLQNKEKRHPVRKFHFSYNLKHVLY